LFICATFTLGIAEVSGRHQLYCIFRNTRIQLPCILKKWHSTFRIQKFLSC